MPNPELPFDLDVYGELCIPGFSRQEAICGRGRVPVPRDSVGRPPGEWYERFRELVLDAAERRRWLPVYRLSDGEFMFMVGKQFMPYPWRQSLIVRLKHLYASWRYGSTFYSSGRPGYCESYSLWELPAARAELAKCLRRMAGQGALCFNFSHTPLALPYMKPVCRWLSARDITIPSSAYYHFYHVYGLLNGPDCGRLLAGRHVVVMTSNIGNRSERLRKTVLERGAAAAHFYETSLNKPALDRIDLSRMPDRVDIVLLGAGVGAAHIMSQLEPLGCVAIDAGFALDCWAEPSLAATRPYCVPDSQWERVHGTAKPAWCQ